MISPHTPPGTKVVCIEDDLAVILARYVKAPWRITAAQAAALGLSAIAKGSERTVASIRLEDKAVSGFGVVFEEHEGTFPLECFRVRDLPESITSLLVVDKILEPA